MQTCSCGASFQDCPHWSSIKAAVLKKVDAADLATNFTEFNFFKNKYLNRFGNTLHEWGFLKQKQARLARANQVLVEEILLKEGKTVFLDSSKVINQAVFLSEIEPFECYIIWLTRDPRAQVYSALKYNNWSIETASKRWVQEMQKNEAVLQKKQLNYSPLLYENLCRQPEQEMERIFNFVGLDASQFSLNFREQEQHIMGNARMRLGKDAKIKERKDWVDQLDASQIKIIERITSAYQNYYGTA